jgi:hypothetical protein
LQGSTSARIFRRGEAPIEVAPGTDLTKETTAMVTTR